MDSAIQDSNLPPEICSPLAIVVSDLMKLVSGANGCGAHQWCRQRAP